MDPLPVGCTATYSDYANGISKEYGFWPDDAFASGGSVGYDHKAMGITARGAWESVKRHFREMDVDTQTTDFTMVGIGDMSGDVFGNGMLLSRHIRLLAAFDHRHTFLDPDPDTAASFTERERLFRPPRSSWADDATGLLSAGGSVHARSAKSIALTPQLKAMLDVAADALTPTELVNAILKAPVDLLYNGGIGTYVMAHGETHAEVGDRANDALRVDGRELRCKVVAEGGNLGCTQLGRIEYARNGGRIYTDAIDNAAGVDTSDHEVNIKILFGLAVADGTLDGQRRNVQLASMMDEVAALVLRDNYFQTQVLSITGRIAPALLDAQSRFIRFLEKPDRLNRWLEFLPPDDEIAQRRRAGPGLAAAEAAVLLAYSKMRLSDEMLASTLPDDPWVLTALQRNFPAAMTQRHGADMMRHPLKREIIATHVISSMVNRVGSTFVHRLIETTGAKPHGVIRAYLLAHEVFGLVPLWLGIEALDNKLPDAVQAGMLTGARDELERATTWFLRSRCLSDDMATTIARFRAGVDALSERVGALLDTGERERIDGVIGGLEAAGVHHDLAVRVTTLPALLATLDIAEVAGASDKPVTAVAEIFFEIGNRLGLPRLRERIAALPGGAHWQILARSAMQDDLAGLQRTVTQEVAAGAGGAVTAETMIAAGQDRNRRPLERVAKLLTEVRAVGEPDAAMLAVVLREMRALA